MHPPVPAAPALRQTPRPLPASPAALQPVPRPIADSRHPSIGMLEPGYAPGSVQRPAPMVAARVDSTDAPLPQRSTASVAVWFLVAALAGSFLQLAAFSPSTIVRALPAATAVYGALGIEVKRERPPAGRRPGT